MPLNNLFTIPRLNQEFAKFLEPAEWIALGNTSHANRVILDGFDSTAVKMCLRQVSLITQLEEAYGILKKNLTELRKYPWKAFITNFSVLAAAITVSAIAIACFGNPANYISLIWSPLGCGGGIILFCIIGLLQSDANRSRVERIVPDLAKKILLLKQHKLNLKIDTKSLDSIALHHTYLRELKPLLVAGASLLKEAKSYFNPYFRYGGFRREPLF